MQLDKQFDAKKIQSQIKDYLANIDLHKMIECQYEDLVELHKRILKY